MLGLVYSVCQKYDTPAWVKLNSPSAIWKAALSFCAVRSVIFVHLADNITTSVLLLWMEALTEVTASSL